MLGVRVLTISFLWRYCIVGESRGGNGITGVVREIDRERVEKIEKKKTF